MGRLRTKRGSVAVVVTVLIVGAMGVAIGSRSAAAASVGDEASFRAAWADPNATSIVLDADIVLTCGNGGVAVRNSATALTVSGNDHVVRQSCAANGVLRQEGAGSVTLQSVTITGGAAAGDGGGLAAAGDVVIVDSTVTANTAGGKGGGIWTSASATVTGSALSDNQAGLSTPDGYGGGLWAQGHLALTDSVVTANIADGSGGASGNSGATILRSTISNNVGPGGAGGTGSLGSITVQDSTISGNTALQSGAGGVGAVGPITLVNSTVVDNQAGAIGGGGVFSDSTTTLVYATVVANGTTGVGANVVGSRITSFGSVVALAVNGEPGCRGTTSSQGYDFSDDDSCGFTAATDRQNAGDPNLGALADNGGPTLTRAPLSGSPLAGVIPTGACQADGAAGITTDQRGAPRPQGSACDIGAVETAASSANAPLIPTQPVVLQPMFTG
jgi:hypothetical protein